MEKLIKIGLAAALLLCLFDMPYGYYQFIRFFGIIGFTIFAYNEYEKQNIPLVIVYTGLIILFQPFIKFALGRQIWNIVDIIVAVGLIITTFKSAPRDSH